MGYLGETLTQVFTCARGRRGRVTQRCHNSPRWETGLASANDVTHRKRAKDLGNSKKVSRVETRYRTRRVDFRLLACLGRCRTRWGPDEKARIERFCVSLLMSKKTLNSKVIKIFVPELGSRKCFSRFEIPMFYVYIRTSPVHFAYPCIWLWYKNTQFSSIWPIDRIISGATTPGSEANKGVLCVPQSSSNIGVSPSDCQESYTGHSLQGVLLLCTNVVGVFCSPSWREQQMSEFEEGKIVTHKDSGLPFGDILKKLNRYY